MIKDVCVIIRVIEQELYSERAAVLFIRFDFFPILARLAVQSATSFIHCCHHHSKQTMIQFKRASHRLSAIATSGLFVAQSTHKNMPGYQNVHHSGKTEP